MKFLKFTAGIFLVAVFLFCLPALIKGDFSGTIVVAVLSIICFWGYFAPTLMAGGREHHQTDAIFWLNLLLGWTFIGWVAAIVWAYTKVERDERTQETPAPVVQERRGNIVPFRGGRH